jgi:tRNA(fMet)-specific endonuclease VapC
MKGWATCERCATGTRGRPPACPKPGRGWYLIPRLARFFAPLRSLPFDDEAAARYGLLRAQLRREGRPVGAHDMMIAAIALAADMTLVTRNEREFAVIAGLRVMTW